MARQGVWQLQKLILNYCEFSGSSRGARVFVEKLWPEFTAGNPQLDATLHVHPGRHPNLTAQYLNGRVRTVGLRNEDPDEIMRQAILLRSSTGRKAALQVKTRQGLIAINYAARARGITRHMRVHEARARVPELVLVHVETVGADAPHGADAGVGADPAKGAPAPNRSTQKASLERYRRSTAEVLTLLHAQLPGAVIEKASIDEVYIDVTAEVERALSRHEAHGGLLPEADSVVIGGPLNPGSEFERRLGQGAGLAARLRAALFEQLGYTSSAGIASNKLLAKVASAMNKPNRQTIVPPRAALSLMQA
ncbi:N-acetyltransferase eso1 [Auxenochlorella protothecoides]|uniref:N-acetyltransferase eso1 n=1 Tax=Auxenochlorella protothecoides TaxID=3075 RepID=A0A087SIV5_AUXPR|nr:N-acetyltransferase eso1 [Auxenochlorella protothecoides]KFM25659.1 N-acetyltransferase eso1 [Auxenochlorella protothecoides]RMZ57200.1 hypothetical protein APUTEX25_004034 [Auxenochlorella protothecoides]|eukprot:RMZ57200.1 hypothetical protein APUTEX25_004034 [Auxenochlorella protothecoides]